MPVNLHALATATPPHELPQDLVQRHAEKIFGGRFPHFERLAAAFTTSGIETRYSVMPVEWFSSSHGWSDRNSAYLKGAVKLFVSAARSALVQAKWKAADVDVVVTVSSTGVATPTLEALAFRETGFRNDIERIPIFGLGCAGGVSGLSIARTHAQAHPGKKVLLVVVEACTLSFRADRLQKADIIAAVLFGDGAAAACLSSEPASDGSSVALAEGAQRMWSDTLDIMGWDVDDTGLGVVFDRSIPDFVTQRFAEATDTALAASGLDRTDIDRFICHPGGMKVVEAIEGTLALDSGSLDAERHVLRDYGNMSAPTVLFVLKEVIESGATGQMVACALGPGFTASFIPLLIERTASCG